MGRTTQPARIRFRSLAIALGLLDRVLAAVAGTVLLVLAVLTTADALGRYLLNMPIPGAGEITEDYLMVALIFLPLSHTFMQGGHVHVTLFERYIPKRARGFIERANLLLAFLLFALITAAGWRRFVEAYRIDEISTSSVGYPMWPCYALVPIGCGLLCLRLLLTIVGGSRDPQ